MSIHFKNIFYVFLAVFLLLSSVGISVNKMVCLSKGKASFSILEKKSCCPADENKSNSDALSARCCDFVSGYIQIDLLSIAKPFKIKAAQLEILTIQLNHLVYCFYNFSINPVSAEIPPLLHGISLLKVIHVFRI